MTQAISGIPYFATGALFILSSLLEESSPDKFRVLGCRV